MHELGLASDILRKIQEEAAKRGLQKVSWVKVGLGLSLVSDIKELEHILTDISKGTVAEGMEFQIDLIPVKAACGNCGADFAPKELRIDCPNCGSTDIRLSSGTELTIEEIS